MPNRAQQKLEGVLENVSDEASINIKLEILEEQEHLEEMRRAKEGIVTTVD